MDGVRRIGAALVLLALGGWLCGPAVAEPNSLAGTWKLAPSNSQLLLTLGKNSPGHSWEWETSIGLADLQGLSTDQLRAAGNAVRFAIRKPAGAFNCTGWVAHGSGGGTFVFIPDSAYASALAARGIEQPQPTEQFDLAVEGVTPDFIDQLHKAGLHPNLTELLRLGNEGLDSAYVLGVARSGLLSLTVDDIIRLRDHDVTVPYISDFHRLGYQPDVEQFVRLADHDVSPAWVRQVQSTGLKPSVDDLIRMRDAGV